MNPSTPSAGTPPCRGPLCLAGRRLAVALAASLCGLAQAATQTWTDEADFLAAVGTVRTETFNVYTADQTAGGSRLILDDFTVTPNAVVDAPPLARDIDGSTLLTFDLSWGGWADLVFDQPLRAVGFWINSASVTVSIAASGLDGFGSYRHLTSLDSGSSGLAFIGFTSDQTFNRLVFSGPGCCTRVMALDNVMSASVLAPVPEPAQGLLMAAGLGTLLGWRGLRRRAAGADGTARAA